MNREPERGWATEEFSDVSLGDKRLSARLIKLCDRFANAPESSINQASADWAETKAAYRFFQNQSVAVDEILAAHRGKTAERAAEHKRVLAVQDTSYLVYSSHRKTKGLGTICLKRGQNVKKVCCNGLIMHTCLALSSEGVPLGLLYQFAFRNQAYRRSRRI